MNDVPEITAAIRRLPLTMGRLTDLIAALQGFSVDLALYGDTSEVQNYLLDAFVASEEVRAYQGEESAA